MSTKYYLPNELWDKIMIMSYYLIAREKKKYFSSVHKQLKLLFNDAYDYHIDKYIGYESFITNMNSNGEYEFDEEEIKETNLKTFYSLLSNYTLVECIKAMARNRLEYTQ